MHVLGAMSAGGFEEVLAIHDQASGLEAFLAIHDTSAGPALGGIRRRAYPDEEAALADALRLARAMSYKLALADVPGGGGKMVVLDKPGLDLEGAYRHVGTVLERLGGRYYAGPDVGTGERELGWITAVTRFATSPGPGGPLELAEATSDGVFAGMAAALRHLDGAEDWPRRTVIVQGLGSVGARLASLLIARGVRVLSAEVDAERSRRGQELGVEPIAPGAEYETPCDVLSPCALGGILNAETVPRLACRIVAGAANNVLAEEADGERLHERGVLYVPDFAINSGAVIRGAAFHLAGKRVSSEQIRNRIGSSTAEILCRAEQEDLSPARLAVREARRRIECRREAARNEPLKT
ncbi:MAG: hypothetical protein O7B99_06510 [Planctomycetota bacterium]|nr:hypothetical protein [Planctomycetota bacterium]